MGIDSTNLPSNSPSINFSFCVAVDIVNRAIQQVAPLLYNMAVYNLAGSNLINFANDIPGGNYFENLRARWKLDSFVAGVVLSAADQGTSDSLTTPESLGQLSLSDLQNLRDPYGRFYLQIAQKYGPAMWGLT